MNWRQERLCPMQYCIGGELRNRRRTYIAFVPSRPALSNIQNSKPKSTLIHVILSPIQRMAVLYGCSGRCFKLSAVAFHIILIKSIALEQRENEIWKSLLKVSTPVHRIWRQRKKNMLEFGHLLCVACFLPFPSGWLAVIFVVAQQLRYICSSIDSVNFDLNIPIDRFAWIPFLKSFFCARLLNVDGRGLIDGYIYGIGS